MIRPIDIRLNAAHPELPLAEAVTFTSSPSTVLIRGVPPNCGRWAITAVFVAASFPDGSTTTRAAVESAEGVWVATIPGTATSGRTVAGFRILADGIDENGEAVTGYILGVADFAVASLDVTPAPEPGETSYQMLYFDAVPSVLRKGDVTKIDGVLKFYNGSAWEAFASSVTLDSSVTPTSGNGVKSSGIWSAIWGALVMAPAASAYAWVMSLVSTLSDSISTLNDTKASKADATLTEHTVSEWAVEPETYDGVKIEIREDVHDGVFYGWQPFCGGRDIGVSKGSEDDSVIEWRKGEDEAIIDIVATRTTTTLPGYRLGPDAHTNPNRNKPLASEAEAEALRDGKLDKSGGTMTGTLGMMGDINLPVGKTQHRLGVVDSYDANEVFITPTRKNTGASLSSLLDIAPFYDSSTSYVVGQLCIKDDALVKCTTAGTGSAAVFAEATVEDVLAALRMGKADKSDVDPLLFAQYYPEGNVKSAAEFTPGIKYDDPDTTNRTITVKPFCSTGTPYNDNSLLVGRVVIPPFVDAQGDPYISDDGTRYKVVGVSGTSPNETSSNLTDIIAPNTVTSIGRYAFDYCEALTTVSLPAVTTILDSAFNGCSVLTSVDFGATPRSSVPALGINAFHRVPNTCKIIVPYTQYDAWTEASGWSDLPQDFVRHAEKADKPATFTAGNLAALDASGNPTDSGYRFEVRNGVPYIIETAND